MTSAVGESVVRLAYGLFFALLVYAVADYGLTRGDSHARFQMLTAGVLGVWLLGCVLAWRLPRTGWIVWVPVLALLVLGFGKAWLDAFFRREILEASDIALAALSEPASLWGILYQTVSINPASSWTATGTAGAVLGGLLIAIEIWRNPVWGRALLLWMLGIGLGITVLFFLQKSVGAPFQPLNLAGRPTSFFTYNYWGNGAAFLNLFWPVALAIMVFSAIQRGQFWTFWFVPPALIFAAVFVNISKAGNALALGALVLIGLLLALPVWRMMREQELHIKPGYAAAVLLPVVVIGISCYYAIPWDRWEHYIERTDSVESDTRFRASMAFLAAIPDAGWTGFGPGTWDGLHRRYLADFPDLLRTPFWTAHQDYIQTAVEWGYLGAACWGILFSVGGIALLLGVFRRAASPRPVRRHYGWGIWDPARRFFLAMPWIDQPVLLAGVLTAVAVTATHAAVDFPFQVPSLGLYFCVWIAAGWALALEWRSTQMRDPDDWDDDD